MELTAGKSGTKSESETKTADAAASDEAVNPEDDAKES